MKTLLAITSILILNASCNTGTKKIEYGANNGRYVTINNCKIYYEEYGDGIPLLLLSGGGINRSIKDFEKCIPALSQHYKVIAPDTPGQGRSGQTDSLSYYLLTDLMSQFIDSLKIDSCYVMGWSDGGIVSLLLSDARADKVKKAIAVGANNGMKGFVLPEGFPLDSVQAPSLEYWASINKKDIEWYNTLTPKKDWKKTVSNMNKMVYQKEYFSDSIYNNIHIPVMIVLGDNDMISIEHGLEMHKEISNSQYCVLPNTTHEVFTEKPELINDIAMDFFE